MFAQLSEFEELGDFAIGLAIAKGRFGNHTGILTKQYDEIKFFHLAWHIKLELTAWDEFKNDNSFIIKRWVSFPELNDDELVASIRVPAIIDALELVYGKNKNQITYAMHFRYTTFSPEGELALGPNENGLTCATFVAAFFDSVAVQLIDIASWPEVTPEDVIWKQKIIEIMKKHHVDVEIIERVLNEPFNYRIRPEQIAASASLAFAGLPSDYQYCYDNGNVFCNISAT